MTNPGIPIPRQIFHDPDSGLDLPYRLFVPASCAARQPCGLLLFLHGAGERGNDNEAQLRNHALVFASSPAQQEFPTIVVYPQCPQDKQWVDADWTKGTYDLARTPISQPLAAVIRLLDTLVAKYPIDHRRQLVTGLSMGGYGTWDLLARFPHRFAGALPLCGGGDPSRAQDLRGIPLWAFHGGADQVVPVRGSRKMVNALRAVGDDPRYTELADVGHDIWNQAYTTPDVVRWLLARPAK
jgi:predicted peptidase